MPELKIGESFQTPDKSILVETNPPLSVGRHHVRLVVVDASGNASEETVVAFDVRERREAGPFTLTLTAGVPPVVRNEGLTEKVGDLLLVGAGGSPAENGQEIALVNISVFLNTVLTSPLIEENIADVVLLIDQIRDGLPIINASEFRGLKEPLRGNGAGLDYAGGRVPNFFLGTRDPARPNQVTFAGIPLEPPGSGTRTFRITNLRINATALGGGGATVPSGINALVSLSPSSIPLANPQATLGFVQTGARAVVRTTEDTEIGPGIIVRRGGPDNLRLRQRPNRNFQAAVFNVAFDELSADVFRNRESERSSVTAKTVQPLPGSALPSGVGEASNGLQFRARLTGIPADWSLMATTREVSPGTTPFNEQNPAAVLIVTGGPPPGREIPAGDAGNFGAAPLQTVSIVGGAAEVVWEWVGNERDLALTLNQVSFSLVLVSPSDALPPPSFKINASLAPVVPGNFSSAMPLTAPVPRFGTTGTDLEVRLRLG